MPPPLDDDGENHLHHAWVTPGDKWPDGVPRDIGGSRDGRTLIWMAGREEDLGLDVYWVQWFSDADYADDPDLIEPDEVAIAPPPITLAQPREARLVRGNADEYPADD